MIEQKNGRRAHDSLLKVENLVILTAVEHLVNGSTPPSLRMRESYSVPHGIIDGLIDPEELVRLREAQRFIPAQDVSEHFLGPDGARLRTVILRLPDIDPVSCEAEGFPTLHGLFIADDEEGRFGRLVTDPRKLRSLGLRSEAVQSYLADKIATWVNGNHSPE